MQIFARVSSAFNDLRSACPLPPAIAIPHEYLMRREDICHSGIGRARCLGCAPPCTWVEDLKETLGVAASIRNRVICSGIEARFTLCNLHSSRRIGPKNLLDHGYY